MPIFDKKTNTYLDAVYCFVSKKPSTKSQLDRAINPTISGNYIDQEDKSIIELLMWFYEDGVRPNTLHDYYVLVKIINDEPLEYIILKNEEWAHEINRFEQLINLK